MKASGRLYTVWPPSHPSCRPVSRMLIASVKMNALKLALMTRKPLKVPTIRPTPSTTRSPNHGLHSVPRPELSFGATSHAPSSAARPNVPCSEMSNLPVSRISDSATTSMPRSAPPCATLMRFDVVKKTGLTIAPAIIRTMITGTSVSSRNQFRTISRQSRRPTAEPAATGRSAVVSAIDILHHPRRLESLHRGDEALPIPGRPIELAGNPTPHHDQQSRADAQVLEVVRDQEYGHAFVSRLADGIQQRLLGRDVDSDRGIHDHEHRWIRGE